MLERDIVAAIKRYLHMLGEDVFFWKERRRPLWDFGRARYYLLLQGTVPGAGSQAAGRQAHAAAKAGAGEDQPRRRHRPEGGSVEDVKAVIERADREAREGVHHVVS